MEDGSASTRGSLKQKRACKCAHLCAVHTCTEALDDGGGEDVDDVGGELADVVCHADQHARRLKVIVPAQMDLKRRHAVCRIARGTRRDAFRLDTDVDTDVDVDARTHAHARMHSAYLAEDVAVEEDEVVIQFRRHGDRARAQLVVHVKQNVVCSAIRARSPLLAGNDDCAHKSNGQKRMCA